MRQLLTDQYFQLFCTPLDFRLEVAFQKLKARDWTPENFQFATAVSVMSSSRIEGETLEIDSYVKHKTLNVEYLANLTERPNDLYQAYEFARDNDLSKSSFLKSHSIATEHLLPAPHRGVLRKSNMVIMEQHTQRVQYEAADAGIVEKEFDEMWSEINHLIKSDLTTEEICYYAAFIHLVFVKIHPFNDGNGRAGRLLEKWFLATKLGERAWFIPSELYYYRNLKNYYDNLARTGLFYDETQYDKALPFLLMLPQAMKAE